MEVTRLNFKETLPLVAQALKEATFITIDGEFTGLSRDKTQNAFDTPEERYMKLKKGAMDFLLIQFGLCTFHHDPKLDRYEQKAFNFYIFPRPYNRNAPDVRFLCQSSSLEFLVSVGFDFNKLFKDGIPYLLPVDEQRLREQLELRHQQQDQFQSPQSRSPDIDDISFIKSPVIVPNEHKSFIEDVCKIIEKMLESDQEILELDPCNAFLRKLIYQTVKSRFRTGIHMDTKKNDKNERYIVIMKANEEKVKEMGKAKQTAEMEELEEAVGFSKVIRMISESGKPVVGHNMLLDICHIIHQVISPLPNDYEEFKSLIKCVFPKLIDTKLMASSHPFKEKINSTTLGELQALLEKPPFTKPVVVPAVGYNGYTTNTEQLHEAGYDAYITGLCFITMANYINTLQPNSKKQNPSNSSLLEPFINKLFLMRVHDIPYINLNGDDLKPARDHVFHVTFPKEWKTSDLIQLFGPFGPVYVAWITDTSAFVSLNKTDQAGIVMRTLTQSDIYHVRTYADFVGEKPKMTVPTFSSDFDTSTWPKKKALRDTDGSLSNKRKRKSSIESKYSRRSIDTIPEEEEEQDAAGEPPEKKQLLESNELEKNDHSTGSNSDKLFDEPVWE